MTLESLLSEVTIALERASVPYMITGSVASSAFGAPRSTRDLDIVISPTREELLALVGQFSANRYYADEQQALSALSRRSQFNVIDSVSGWKIDFIIAKSSAYERQALERRVLHEISGVAVYVSAPEDAVISKLRWAKVSSSDRQLQDAAGILSAQGDKLDIQYIEQWARELHLEDLWETIRREQP